MTKDFTHEEQTLVEMVQRGDVQAYSCLVEQHVSRLRAFVALNAPAPHLVNEIAHDTFVYAYLHIAEFKSGSFFHWIKAIARNLLRAEVQRYSRDQVNKSNYAELGLFVTGEAPSTSYGTREVEFLEQCLRELDASVRKLLDEKYVLGFSAKEIASRLEQSEAQVKSMLFRLRQQLRECIDGRMAMNAHD
jgi:RNA polymerase sigma-70 factor (ECF subfamily)